MLCVCVQWALHHLCDGSVGVSDLLPWLDCSPAVGGCHSYLLQGRQISFTAYWQTLHVLRKQ